MTGSKACTHSAVLEMSVLLCLLISLLRSLSKNAKNRYLRTHFGTIKQTKLFHKFFSCKSHMSQKPSKKVLSQTTPSTPTHNHSLIDVRWISFLVDWVKKQLCSVSGKCARCSTQSQTTMAEFFWSVFVKKFQCVAPVLQFTIWDWVFV